MRKELLIIFGKNVRTWRKKRNLSQEMLAEKAESHPNYIGFIERGERAATIVKLVALSKALDCRVTDLLKGII